MLRAPFQKATKQKGEKIFSQWAGERTTAQQFEERHFLKI